MVELKVGEFAPADRGRPSFLRHRVDETLRDRGRDEPTLGVILCRGRSELVVEYTLRGVHEPLGVTTYEHLRALRPGLPEALPPPGAAARVRRA